MMKAEKTARGRNSVFVSEYLRSPRRVGAIAPSSGRLASAMTDGLSDAKAPVIELGPGTGVFTRALLDRGIAPKSIAAIELSDHFADHLSAACPDVLVIQGDATQVHALSPFGTHAAHVVVCGLPLLSMPVPSVMRILERSFRCLRADGEFRFFTYARWCPVPADVLSRLGLAASRVETVLFNAPPASVFRVQRISPGVSA